jgi:hypothetical protein
MGSSAQKHTKSRYYDLTHRSQPRENSHKVGRAEAKGGTNDTKGSECMRRTAHHKRSRVTVVRVIHEWGVGVTQGPRRPKQLTKDTGERAGRGHKATKQEPPAGAGRPRKAAGQAAGGPVGSNRD